MRYYWTPARTHQFATRAAAAELAEKKRMLDEHLQEKLRMKEEQLQDKYLDLYESLRKSKNKAHEEKRVAVFVCRLQTS